MVSGADKVGHLFTVGGKGGTEGNSLRVGRVGKFGHLSASGGEDGI